MLNRNNADTLSAFALLAYYQDEDAEKKYTPAGFLKLCDCPKELQKMGYFGKAYYKWTPETNSVQLVITHRGTDNAKNAFDDINIYLQDAPKAWEQAAKPFTDYAVNLATKMFPTEKIYKTNVGHSLGAIHCDLSHSYLVDKQDADLTTLSCGSFENPGSLNMIKGLISDKTFSTGVIEKAKPTAFIYNNDPDAITTCGPQLSDAIFHCKSGYTFESSSDPTTEKYYTSTFTLDQHHMIKLYDLLNSSNDVSSKITQQNKWPYGSSSGWGLVPGYDYYTNYKNNPDYWDLAIQHYWDSNPKMQKRYSSYDAFKADMIATKLSNTTSSLIANSHFAQPKPVPNSLETSWQHIEDKPEKETSPAPEPEKKSRYGMGCSVM